MRFFTVSIAAGAPCRIPCAGWRERKSGSFNPSIVEVAQATQTRSTACPAGKAEPCFAAKYRRRRLKINRPSNIYEPGQPLYHAFPEFGPRGRSV
jgi:hypothetical protein